MSIDTMKQALEALELHGQQYPHMVKGYCVDAITALRAAIEQAEKQEPHGYLVHRNWKEPRFVGADDLEGVPNLPFRNPEYTPLYTAPPQREWQGLTDEEVRDIVWNLPYEPSQEHIRAIEQAIKEKNT